MIKTLSPQKYAHLDRRRLLLPILVSTILLIGVTFLPQVQVNGVLTLREALVLGLWIAATCYAIVFYYLVLKRPRLFERLRWVNTFFTCVGIIGIQVYIPQLHVDYFGIYLLLLTTSNAILYGRQQAWLIFAILTTANILLRLELGLTSLPAWTEFVPTTLISAVLSEIILRVQDNMKDDIRRLEIVNEFARRSALSLNTEDVLSALKTTIANAIRADTYFVGILEGDTLRLPLLFDDGEYLAPTAVKCDGTLSNWVIQNNTTLFIPDLREEPPLEGIGIVIIGKDKLNLCWLGVPMKTPDITGILTVASYMPNAFGHTDIELIQNLAQHTAQALGNTFQHAKVELQSRLDSLTGVYNHGYFLRILEEEIEKAVKQRHPLSLVMIDVDYFKQYNDKYGHMVGDAILVSLCEIIRRYTKKTDTLGRWGGEEFSIVLPNADGLQALEVCKRIQDAMRQVAIPTSERKSIPAPTISQGIALCPDEAQEITALIHLADKRLYLAKERGRNQIEPGQEHWQRIIQGRQSPD